MSTPLVIQLAVAGINGLETIKKPIGESPRQGAFGARAPRGKCWPKIIKISCYISLDAKLYC